MKKYVAELLGTFALVLVGCGAVTIGGPAIGIVGVALAFGLILMALVYAIGPISGCHVNPAVSLGAYCAGRITMRDLIGYIISQLIGAVIAAAFVLFMARGEITGYSPVIQGLGQNGWGLGYMGQYTAGAAILFEFIGTMIFVMVILETTDEHNPTRGFAGLAIGLTLAALHFIGINITGVSVNPARSFGPAFILGGKALSQVWLFLVIPSLAGIAAGFLSRGITIEGEERVTRLRVQPQ